MTRKFSFLWLMAVVALIAAACTPGGSDAGECPTDDVCVVVGPDDSIKIGTSLVITTSDASLGLDSQHGVELAADGLPSSQPAFDGEYGKILGHTVELVFDDDECSADGGQASLTRLTSDKQIVAVVGTSCSSAGEPASQIAGDAGVLIVSPSNTAPSLTAPATRQPTYFRTAHNDKVQGAAMAKFAIEELKAKTAATINDGSPYADQLQQVFADTFTDMGGTVTKQEAIAVGDTDFGPLLTSIAADSPDFLYYPIFTDEGGLITQQAREEKGLAKTTLAGADGMLSPAWLKAAGAADAEGVYLSGPDLGFAGDFYKDTFVPAYTDQFGAPTSVFHAHAYDAANMIFQAIEEVAIETDDGGLLIPRQGLVDAFDAIDGYEGILGSLSCKGNNGDCNTEATITVSEVKKGAFEVIWP